MLNMAWIEACISGKVQCLMKYKEKKSHKPVILVPTASHVENKLVTSSSGITSTKPLTIHQYNNCMGGVDVKDKEYLLLLLF